MLPPELEQFSEFCIRKVFHCTWNFRFPNHNYQLSQYGHGYDVYEIESFNEYNNIDGKSTKIFGVSTLDDVIKLFSGNYKKRVRRFI